jgi:hypothetical protein
MIVEVGAIARELGVRIESLIVALGLQGVRQGRDFCAYNPTRADGSLGSFKIGLYGNRQGIWADFAAPPPAGWRTRSGCAAGDALDLVAYCLFGGDKRRAIEWAKVWLGIENGQLPKGSTPVARPAKKHNENPNRGNAIRLFAAGTPSIVGTAAQTYLGGRSIDLGHLIPPAAADRQPRVPRSLRFHPALKNPENDLLYPALLAAIVDPAGKIQSCHRTWLARDPAALARGEKAPLTDAKRSLGTFAGKGCSIRLWRGASMKPLADAPDDDVVAITEGIEDGLTVAVACPEYRVLVAVSLPNMPAVWLPPQISQVILVADNDPGAQAQALFARAVAAHPRAGRIVRIARASGGAKDVNDRLRRGA